MFAMFLINRGLLMEIPQYAETAQSIILSIRLQEQPVIHGPFQQVDRIIFTNSIDVTSTQSGTLEVCIKSLW